MASVNQKHFKAGGGNAAVQKLLAAQAAAARQLTGSSQSSQQSTQPSEAVLARLRAKVAARGKAELERQEKEKTRKERSETTYSGNKVFRNGKHVGNMVNGKFVKLENRDPKIKKVKYPVTIGTAEEKKPEPEKPPETDQKPPSSITGNNRGGGGGGSSDSSGSSSSSSSSSSSGSSTPPRRNGAGVKTPLSGGAGGTRPTGPGPNQKPKSRLEKALSGIGKWEEPKEKPKRNKPTSRFLKKTNNTRRKER